MFRRVKAYTIVELIVVMLISSALISMAYGGFHLVQKLFGRFQSAQETVARTVLLDRLLNHDIGRSQTVRRTPDGLACSFPEKTIGYQFLEECIVRSEPGTQDTFRITPIQVQVLSGGQLAELPGTLVDELSFDNLRDDAQTYHYTKHYAADILQAEPVELP